MITAASGDHGYSGGIAYPAASPDVIAVGGTDLQPDASPRGYSETAWSSTGSGCSAVEPIPAWQTPTSACLTTRMLNDVAAAATSGNFGISYYDTHSSGLTYGSGTAFSAAIAAAAYALAGTPANTAYPASYLYGNASGLYDIADGSSNGTCSTPSFCTTEPGYDGPTGLGTPDGTSAFLSSYYQPINPPARLMDTRIGTGGTTGPVAAHGTVQLQVAGVQGIPSANVTGVVLNLTALSESSSGILVAYPDGWPQPTTSTVNYQAGTNLADLVIVPVGADGKIDIFNSSNGTVQLLGDVFGYFTSDATAAGDSTYTPITPTRILDTRDGTGAPQQPLAGGGTIALQVGGANGIPSGISAVAIDITATNETASGILAAFADGTTPVTPATNLQFGTAAIADMAIVPVAADGKIDIRGEWGNSSNVADVIGDVVGYFAAGTSGETYHEMYPARMIDTRPNQTMVADATLGIPQGNTVIAPSPTMIVNVIATDGTHGGDFVIYPAGISLPDVSNLNWTTGLTIDNLDLASTGGGTFEIHNATSGTTDAVVDCFGYLSAG